MDNSGFGLGKGNGMGGSGGTIYQKGKPDRSRVRGFKGKINDILTVLPPRQQNGRKLAIRYMS